ncbi:MAG: DNA double-strand break repair nuclease NurA [Chloroflexi bacterium]|nr:DNA double-strand break repair nuclease NurA [Chloroflexota bacterium]
MALNFQQVFDQIREIGAGARARREILDALRKRARTLFDSWADKTAELADKVERARQADSNLRCAIPLAGRLDASHPAPVDEKPVTLLAADGSQILPDRHAALLYSLVNVGAIVLETRSGRAPETFTDSNLYYADEIYTETGMLTEEAIEQRRDIAERKKLLELAKPADGPCVALTDGPVELWGAKNGGEGDYRKNLEIHKSVLSQMQAKNMTVAGYVDKPGADLLIRTLEIAGLADEQMKDIRRQHPLRGVSDRWLFSAILEPGCRSAIFGLQSSSRPHYTGSLALHFFYLNVGQAKRPSLVRVEIPQWVADDEEKLNLLHAALLEQCRIMGARPYPYILHRAHEIAVVKFEEKRQVEQMLEIELRKAGSELDEGSNKQSAKDLKGRSRNQSAGRAV